MSETKKGFTLVETIVATVILSLAVLGLAAIAAGAMGNTRQNRRREVAAGLADRQLTMIDQMGIEEFIQTDIMEGVFEDYDPPYAWSVVTQADIIDYLYQVRMTVTWTERNRQYSVVVDTMLNGKGLLTELE
jgi:Tfp pilus assembly protein PilV